MPPWTAGRKPAPGDAEALLIESDLDPVGTFECSNDLFNRIHQLNLWTIRCLSLGGYMVDCPHRERLGYGDGQTSIDTQIMNRNAPAFYAKWATDWLDAQDPATGRFPFTAALRDQLLGRPGMGRIGTCCRGRIISITATAAVGERLRGDGSLLRVSGRPGPGRFACGDRRRQVSWRLGSARAGHGHPELAGQNGL